MSSDKLNIQIDMIDKLNIQVDMIDKLNIQIGMIDIITHILKIYFYLEDYNTLRLILILSVLLWFATSQILVMILDKIRSVM